MTTPVHQGTSTVYGNEKPRTSFTAQQQAIMDQGGNYAGYAVVDGHFTYVGAGRTGQDAYNAVYGGTATAPVDPSAPTTADPGDMGMTGNQLAPSTASNPNDPQAPTLDPNAADKLASQRNALALIKQTLQQYGLPDSLGDWAWQELVAGKGSAEIMLDLQQRPEFKAAFPEIDARLQKGLAPLSPGDIISYRQQARQVMAAAGLPSGFYDSKDDFTGFISNDMSINELTNRIDLAKQATFTIPTEVRARLESEFGLTPGSGGLTAYFLDGAKALPLLQRDFQAGQVGGAADRVGYRGVSNDTARQLVDLGVSEQQAQQGFGDLAQKSGLFEALPGQGEDVIDQQTQIGAEFGGNANAQRRIENRQRKRLADFQGGGDFASSQGGLVGLGKANG